MNADIRVSDDPAEAAAELLAAAHGHVALTGGSTPRAAYERVADAAPGLVGRGLLVHRRALRAARPRALELRHGRPGAAVARSRARPSTACAASSGREEGAAAYEKELDEFGPEALDLILLGVGPDAHICSLFPGDDALGERERRVVGVETPGMAPLVARITLTLPVVNSSGQIVFLVTGEDKAEAVAARVLRAARTRARRARSSRGDVMALLDPRGGRPAMTEWAPDRGVTASPFPPIADYAFLSDCETCALVAPNGNVEWLCLPRFDSPSVFGAILDRDAGGFRLGPADVEVPAARRYLPGTNVLETSWGTSGGWIIVRDVLLIGPWHHEHERSHTHRRAPTDYDADHVLLRMIRCVNGELQVTMDCDPRFDYARKTGEWEYTGPGYHEAVCRAEDCEVELRLTTDMNMGFEGPRATARTLMKEGDTLFVALSWSEHPAPQTYEDAYDRLVWTAHHWQHWLDHGNFPDHPWRTHLQRAALTLKGLSYAPTGALVAAADHLAAGDARAASATGTTASRWIRDSTFMLWGLYTLGFDWEANDFFYFIADIAEQEEERPPDHVPDRRRGRDPGVHARPPVRLRGRAAGAHRQRRLQPGAARRLGRPARLDLPAHQVAQPPARPDLADRQAAGGAGAREVARAGPRDLGDPRRAEALHLVEDDVLGRRGPRRAPGRDPRRARVRRRAGSRPPTRSRRTSSRTASTSAACSPSTTTPTRSTPRCS